jgi:hypothetical protein
MRSLARIPRATFPEFLILLVWALFWWPVISGQEFPYIRDLALFAVPMKTFMVERLASGELPLWTPHVSAGMPFLADVSNQLFYPLNVVFVLFSSVLEALSWFIALHDLLAMLAFYWLCRATGLSRGVAVWGGMAYGLSGYVLSITDNVNFLPAIAWVPAALAAHSVALSRKSTVFSAVTALCLAAMVLAGDAMNVVLLCGVLLLLSVEAALTERARHGARLLVALRWPLGQLAIAAILAFVITSVQILPTIELAQVTARHTGLVYEEASKWSFPFMRLIELGQPFFFAANFPTFDFLGAGLYPLMAGPWASSVYLGTFTVLLAVIGIATGVRRALVWILVLAPAILMSFGANAPYHQVLFENLPFLATQRYPEKLLFWVTLAACVLAARGAQWLLDRPLDAHSTRPRPGGVLKVAASIAVPMFAAWAFVYVPVHAWIWEEAHLSPHIWSMRLPLVPSHIQVLALHTVIAFALLAALIWIRPRRQRAYLTALLAIGIADLAWVHYGIVPTVPQGLFASRDMPYALQHVIAQKDSPGAYRIYFDVRSPGSDVNYEQLELAAQASNALGADMLDRGYVHVYAALFRRDRLQVNSGVERGVQYLNGRMSPLQPAAHLVLEDYLLARDPARLMALSNVRYVVSSIHPANLLWEQRGFVLRHTDTERNLRIFEVDDYLPRALIVPDAVIVGGGFDEALMAVAAIVDPRRTLVVSAADDGSDGVAAAATLNAGAVTLSRPSPELFVTSGTNPYEHAYLLLNESYFDGWAATLDGAPAKLLRANGRFMAIALGPGAFEATLRYHSTYLAPGAALSLAGVVLCAWLLAGSPTPRRSKRQIPLPV